MTDQKRSAEWWDRWFLGLVRYVATASKDPSTQVGCVVISQRREMLAGGYNGFPRGVADTKERLENREHKYKLVIHAEANAVVNASLTGTSLDGATLYCTHSPCSSCAGLIIQAGISRLVVPVAPVPARWLKSTELAFRLLDEAGVEVEVFGGAE